MATKPSCVGTRFPERAYWAFWTLVAIGLEAALAKEASENVQLGFSAATLPALGGAITGAWLTWGMVQRAASDYCGWDAHLDACVSGVVTRIERSFASLTDNIFPFTAMFDRVDVV